MSSMLSQDDSHEEYSSLHVALEAKGGLKNWYGRFKAGQKLNHHLDTVFQNTYNPQTKVFMDLPNPYEFFRAHVTLATLFSGMIDEKQHRAMHGGQLMIAERTNHILYGNGMPNFRYKIQQADFDDFYKMPKRTLFGFLSAKKDMDRAKPGEEERWQLSQDFASSLTAAVCKSYQICDNREEAFAGATYLIKTYKMSGGIG
jgi:hypothetical protein